MIKDKKWIAFFSHTGTEIYNLYKQYNIKPDRIVTNKQPGDKEINPKLLKMKCDMVYLKSKPSISDYNRVLLYCDAKCFCTLHGWMRIVPEAICNDYEMYNLHPGLITKYPELKGKDPQSRVDFETHKYIGAVIHDVVPGVDEGPVLVGTSVHNHYYSTQQVDSKLRDLAISAWGDLFKMKGIL